MQARLSHPVVPGMGVQEDSAVVLIPASRVGREGDPPGHCKTRRRLGPDTVVAARSAFKGLGKASANTCGGIPARWDAGKRPADCRRIPAGLAGEWIYPRRALARL
jgi:hypothetical protein